MCLVLLENVGLEKKLTCKQTVSDIPAADWEKNQYKQLITSISCGWSLTATVHLSIAPRGGKVCTVHPTYTPYGRRPVHFHQWWCSSKRAASLAPSRVFNVDMTSNLQWLTVEVSEHLAVLTAWHDDKVDRHSSRLSLLPAAVNHHRRSLQINYVWVEVPGPTPS